MPTLAKRLALLRRHPPEVVSAILAGTLPDAEPAEQAEVCEVILTIGSPDAVARVIELMDRLEPGARDVVIASPIALGVAAAGVARIGRLTGIRNVLRLALIRCDADFLPLLVDWLPSPEPGVGSEAADALLGVVERYVGPHGTNAVPPDEAEQIDSAVARAADTWPRHRRPEVLDAVALCIARIRPGLAACLADIDHPVLAALRSVPANHDQPTVQRNMLRWILDDALGRVALRWIPRIQQPRALAALLETGHLLLNPARRRAISRMPHAESWVPDYAAMTEIPADARTHAIRLAQASDLDDGRLIRRLADARSLSSPTARLLALRGLLCFNTLSARRAVGLYALDEAPAVGFLAGRRLLQGPEGHAEETLARLESTGTFIAEIARLRRVCLSVDALLGCFSALTEPERTAAVRRLVESDHPALVAAMREWLDGGDRPTRIAAIRLIRRVGIVEDLSEALDALIEGDGDTHVVSAAVAALGDVVGGHGAGQRTLEGLTETSCERVLANAVEARGRRGGSAIEWVEPHAANPHNRVRGNAVRLVLRHRPEAGVELLRCMLADDDPMHRVSAIWVARSSRAHAVGAELKSRASDDPAVAIRHRAEDAIRRLAACSA